MATLTTRAESAVQRMMVCPTCTPTQLYLTHQKDGLCPKDQTPLEDTGFIETITTKEAVSEQSKANN